MSILERDNKSKAKAIRLFIALSMSLILTVSPAFVFAGVGDDYLKKTIANDYSEGFQIGNLSFKINEIKTALSNSYRTAPSGYKYLYIYMSATNNGSAQVSMTSNMVFQLSDSQGNNYNISMPEEPGSFNGLINPNATLTGNVCFLVPAAKNEFKLTMKPSTYENNYAKINIVNNQWSVDTIVNSPTVPPTTGTQFTGADIGKEIIINNLSFVINSVYTKDSDPYRTPASGNGILYFDITVKNLSQVQYGMTSTMVFKLHDNMGKTYNVITPEGTNSLNGLINNNKSLNRVVRFEIPKNVNEFYLVIKPSMTSSQTAEVKATR